MDENKELKNEFREMKVICGGIEIPMEIQMGVIDVVFSYIDFYNYFLLSY